MNMIIDGDIYCRDSSYIVWHDPIALMQSIATAYGQDKADKIFNIIKQQEEKNNENNG